MHLILSFLMAAHLMAQDASSGNEWLQRGVEAFRAGNYPAAVQAFQRAVETDPQWVSPHLYLATSYMQQFVPGQQSDLNLGMAESATREFLRVLQLEPENTLAMASLASLELNRKRWDDAEQWFQKLIAVDSDNADAYYSLGYIAWSKYYPPYQEARRSLGMEQTDPGPFPEGAIKQNLKTRYSPVLQAGLKALERALALKPDYADAMAYTNLLIRERADLDDTKEEYQRDIATANDWVDKALAAKKKAALPHVEPPVKPSEVNRIVLLATVAQANKTHDVAPVAPPLAIQAGITGTVRFAIVIGKDGKVIDIKVISGHPLLIPGALTAVKQWEYRPTLLNGQPVEVATETGVDFR